VISEESQRLTHRLYEASIVSWYALQTRSRYEKQAARLLQEKSLEVFLPLWRVQRKWNTSQRVVELPLFAGYLFCSFDAENRHQVLATNGIVRVVGVGQTPVPVDVEELDAIRKVLDSGQPLSHYEYLQSGDRVRIERGVLSGTEGVLVQARNEHRLVISVTLLQRSVAVTIDRDWVSVIGPTATAEASPARLIGPGRQP